MLDSQTAIPASSTPDMHVVPARDDTADVTSLAWNEIRGCACGMAVSEPLLMRRLRNLILGRVSLADAMAAVMAARLDCPELREHEIYSVARSVFEEQSDVMARLVADLRAFVERDPACPDSLHVLLNLKGFQALQCHRVAHSLWHRGRKPLAYFLSSICSSKFAIDIHPAAVIGGGIMLDHGSGIVVGETAMVEDRVSILQGVTLGGTGKCGGLRHPTVRAGVMIGAGACVIGRIEIGMMSKIAAGSVVLKDVPANCTVAGVPARIVRQSHPDSAPAQEMDQRI